MATKQRKPFLFSSSATSRPKNVKPIWPEGTQWPPGASHGLERAWYSCRTCGQIQFRDYTPGALSTPVIVTLCGHGVGERDHGLKAITKEEARTAYAQAAVRGKRCEAQGVRGACERFAATQVDLATVKFSHDTRRARLCSQHASKAQVSVLLSDGRHWRVPPPAREPSPGDLFHAYRRGWEGGCLMRAVDPALNEHPSFLMRSEYQAGVKDGQYARDLAVKEATRRTGYHPDILRTET